MVASGKGSFGYNWVDASTTSQPDLEVCGGGITRDTLIATHIQNKQWCPIKMLNNVFVQMGKVLCFKRAETTTMFILDLRPWAHELVGYVWAALFVASVSFACSVMESAGHMMLSGSDVSEHSGTEATLVSNNKEVKHVSHIVPWLLRHDLVVH